MAKEHDTMKPTINIIGAGGLGKTLAKLIANHHVGIIQNICNKSFKNAKLAIQFIGQGEASPHIEDLPPADITFITTPDDCIRSCCEKLANSNNLKNGSIVLHCSGSLSSEILKPAEKKGCFTASVHPMRSFSDPDISFSNYHGTFCAIEGNFKAIQILRKLFHTIGSIVYEIQHDRKDTYHVAGVFASNYLITLSNIALLCLKNAGVEDKLATKIIISVMQGTLNNLEHTLSPEKSLTGPIKRGDVHIIMQHLNSFPQRKISELYKILGLATLDIANLPKEKKVAIENLLSESSHEHYIKSKL